MDDLILETKDLSKRYDQQMAVHNICMRVRKNTVFSYIVTIFALAARRGWLGGRAFFDDSANIV